MADSLSHSEFIHKLQSLAEQKGHTTRSLAQKCFLWSLYTKKPITTAQLTDALALEYKADPSGAKQPHDYCYYSLSELRTATCNLLLISGFSLSRVRLLNPESEKFLHTAIHDGPALAELKDFFPTPQAADIQLSIYCLEHLLVNAPPADSLSTILPYCASFFDAHMRSLDEIPANVLSLLEKLLDAGPAYLRRVMSFRYSTMDDEYPNIDCPGSPASIDPAFFLRCVNLDRTVPHEMWTRYSSNSNIYPQEYLHLASLTGLVDIVESIIISATGVDVNRVDRAGFTALQYAVKAGQRKVIEILLNAGVSCDDEVNGDSVEMMTDLGDGVSQGGDKTGGFVGDDAAGQGIPIRGKL